MMSSHFGRVCCVIGITLVFLYGCGGQGGSAADDDECEFDDECPDCLAGDDTWKKCLNGDCGCYFPSATGDDCNFDRHCTNVCPESLKKRCISDNTCHCLLSMNKMCFVNKTMTTIKSCPKCAKSYMQVLCLDGRCFCGPEKASG